MKRLPYIVAVALAVFSGGVSTFGLAKFAPGAEYVVIAMGVLFEAGKLTSFAIIHRPMPTELKAALVSVGVLLMALNILGVSGFLSNAYEHRLLAGRADEHVTAATVEVLRQQLANAEQRLSDASAALLKARDDRDRVKAAQSAIAGARAERDAIAAKLADAHRMEGTHIAAGAEFAAVMFVSGATGADQDTVAHAVIFTIAAIPDVLAVLLLLAAGYEPDRKPVVKRRARKTPPRKASVLKMVRNAKAK